MLPDFELIVHKFPERKDITIVPIADVHLGARECMEQEFIKYIDSVKDRNDLRFVLCGDLLNNGIKSSVSSVYDEVYRPSEAKRMMAKILEPIRDRILCAVRGNHEARSSRETDDCPVYDIMAKLDLEELYRENMAFLKLQFGDRTFAGKQRPTYTIAVSHGSGGGTLVGSGINKNTRFAYSVDNLDCLITGHTHRPAVTQPGKIYIDTQNNQVTLKPFKVVTATSWCNTSGHMNHFNRITNPDNLKPACKGVRFVVTCD